MSTLEELNVEPTQVERLRTSLEIPHNYTNEQAALLLRSLSLPRDWIEKLTLWHGTGKYDLTGIISKLPSLNSLELHCCNFTGEESIAFFAELGHLESLVIAGSSLVPLGEILPRTPLLRHLELNDCERIGDLGSLAGLQLLKSLVVGCYRLTDDDLHHISKLSHLERLEISSCNSLTGAGLAHLSTMSRLRYLTVGNCAIGSTNLWFLRSLPGLVGLKLEYNDGITGHLQELSTLTNLESLDLNGCSHLQRMAYISTLSRLERLDISLCGSITVESLMVVAGLPNLRELVAVSCRSINDVSLLRMGEVWRDLKEAALGPQLERLDITSCRNITETGLAVVRYLGKLRSLKAGGCHGISTADPTKVLQLHGLEELDVSGWELTGNGLKLLVSGLGELRRLHVEMGRHLTDVDLQSLCGIPSLEVLRIDSEQYNGKRYDLTPLGLMTGLRELHITGGCSSTDGMSFLGLLTRLERLSITDTHILTDEGLRVVAKLPELRELDLSSCDDITRVGIASLVASKSLRSIMAEDCEMLNGDDNTGDLEELRALMPWITISM